MFQQWGEGQSDFRCYGSHQGDQRQHTGIRTLHSATVQLTPSSSPHAFIQFYAVSFRAPSGRQAVRYDNPCNSMVVYKYLFSILFMRSLCLAWLSLSFSTSDFKSFMGVWWANVSPIVFSLGVSLWCDANQKCCQIPLEVIFLFHV